ncbi:MAG: glycerol uptake facilitator [Burkholderiales bacterium 35-55-47]|jgi:glycerol uptake facilitator-like aquaporin|uniref:aquaporin n=1 Tax=Limnohabitans sp. TaxID=1907725 RepID=UPI000BDB7302|nr:MIP/aquaporin family protein [Limnohabitans sp.]OYY18958.1 MAG: glycerol uptake facilitator [Burkholderiales bacterium 35-55-47]OYZ73776.1 MAG: glycerol uptake facilitator [Burkholderiales bacterium 24-55-52]OZB00921.1 MAG: glycerol uptake facilitator [Burkholderiales bacterium 39-55-53]HQR85290.1 MIP/aquaporin family protein [Limnohabitans sp.]HQS27302.1 MIP/aquaporin family protein [Limnohabitans sp.]
MIHWRRYFAELVGTAALLCAVIGSGIMAEKLAGGNVAVALLTNTLATVFALYALIETLGPISGAHFNPVVSMVLAFRKDLARHHLIGYVIAQLIGAVLGAWAAHTMFELEILQWSTKVRSGPAQWFSEAVATGGLLFVILRSPEGKASSIVACYIGAAYWFTASTSFANPAAAFGRMFTNTFAGIAPFDVPEFIVAQMVGGALGLALHHIFVHSDKHQS